VPPRLGALAACLLRLARAAEARAVLHVAGSERRAEALGRVLREFAPDIAVVVFPPWDCLPYDRAPPSREVMGRRIVALHALAQTSRAPRVVVTTPDALIQRVPAREHSAIAFRTLRVGDSLNLDEFGTCLRKAGYELDERVDEPGEAALRGQVIDVFPPGASAPVRIEHDDGAIVTMRRFDSVSQLTTDTIDDVLLYPAVEYASQGPTASETHGAGWLPDEASRLETLFDYLPDATIVLDAKAEDRRQAVLEQITDAYRGRAKGGAADAGHVFPSRDRFYLSEAEWCEQLKGRPIVQIEEADADVRCGVVPSFAVEPEPERAFARYIRAELKAKRRVVLAAPAGKALRALVREAAKASQRKPVRALDWNAGLAAEPGSLNSLEADLDGGFVDEDVTVVTAVDLWGSRAQAGSHAEQRAIDLVPAGSEFRIGDAVIHLDRGIGLLQGIETVAAEGSDTDMIRLQYADEDKLMVPVDELDRICRYGAPDHISLDRLDGEAWLKRRTRIEEEIAETGRRLTELTRERATRSAPKLVPAKQDYERFARRFPYSETPDQLRAVEDVLDDLARGRPMDRLVCGDVGFGKTEVALRAAAAVALAGKQVAIVAPTTVLVRQHLQTFRRRFAEFGIEIGHLSRLVSPAEARAVKQGLRDGSLRVVIGTHALAGKGIRFKDLGLVVIDEEQRFGMAQKTRLRDVAKNVHVLTLTATPIPRTLQATMIGLQELSTIVTPPAQRRPIRTFLTPFDEVTVRQALLRERRRGGQSFVVCPRIEDIEPMARRLAEIVPELAVLVAHGKMPADAIDETMVRFADGDGDVLLATNIIESGLDVPCANTMLIWRADRFGLAQLHQLRGRVGRGRVRGVAYLLTDPNAKIGAATRKRLQTLTTLERLGAGFAISARDLDARGAGDLFGEDQAGHVKLIGMSLYRHLLARALQNARAAPPREEWSPQFNIGLGGRIPESYVPEQEVRINLYARIGKLADESELELLRDEMEDRFGVMPDETRQLFTLMQLKHVCRRLGIARVDAGPQAVAFTFRDKQRAAPALQRLIKAAEGALAWNGDRLVYRRAIRNPTQQERLIMRLLKKLAAALLRRPGVKAAVRRAATSVADRRDVRPPVAADAARERSQRHRGRAGQ
jgi:transcription-repair coupling factor (superfamily II helicase)